MDNETHKLFRETMSAILDLRGAIEARDATERQRLLKCVDDAMDAMRPSLYRRAV